MIPSKKISAQSASAKSRFNKPLKASNLQVGGPMLSVKQVPIPMMRGFGMASNRRRQIVCEDEYVADISGSVAFANTAFAFNPGQVSTFPWCSKIASNYDRYRVLECVFYYKRAVSEFATNGQSGKVILSFDYDATDPAPTNKQQVEDQDPHDDGMPCENLVLRLDPKRLNSQDSKFVRPGAQPSNTDLKTYDGGVLNVSTSGNANTGNIGELHVKYAIEFLLPQFLNSGQASQHITGVTPTTSSLLGTQTLQAGSTALATVSGLVITFVRAGRYLVTQEMSATTVTNTAALVVSATGSLITTYGGMGGDAAGTFLAGNAGPKYIYICLVDVVVGTTITYGQTVVNGLLAEIFISQVPSGQA